MLLQSAASKKQQADVDDPGVSLTSTWDSIWLIIPWVEDQSSLVRKRLVENGQLSSLVEDERM